MGRQALYVFGWPSYLGGADTRLAHTLPLWRELADVTVVPNDLFRLAESGWRRWIEAQGARVAILDALPRKLDGKAIAFSNHRFFEAGIAQRAKERGLRVIWSSEMMWHHPGELDAVSNGIVDVVLYTSELNGAALRPGYAARRPGLREHVIGNYVDPLQFPECPREARCTFTIGRLSRPDPLKYPDDFPSFYEGLGLEAPAYRVMAWTGELARRFGQHHFDARWELLPPAGESQLEFLRSLDAFVYPLGRRFTESWGRSVVEAMLTGLPVVAEDGHHFSTYFAQAEIGFLCRGQAEFGAACRALEAKPALRRELGARAARFAREALCDRAEHVRRWREILDD